MGTVETVSKRFPGLPWPGVIPMVIKEGCLDKMELKVGLTRMNKSLSAKNRIPPLYWPWFA